MSDDVQTEIEHIIGLLEIEKKSLSKLEILTAQHGLNQPIHISHELDSCRTHIGELRAELAQITLLPLIDDINFPALRDYYRAAFGYVEPQGKLANLLDTHELIRLLFMEVNSDTKVATRFFQTIIQKRPKLKFELNSTLKKYAKHLGINWQIPNKKIQSLTHQNDAVLQIALDPHPHEDNQFRIRAWLWRDSIELRTADDWYASSLEALKERILEVCNQTINDKDVDSSQLTIEVFLPDSMLGAPIHLWLVDQEYGIELSYYNYVHVRFYERSFKLNMRNKMARDQWKTKWDTMTNASRANIHRLNNTQDLNDHKSLFRSLKESVCYVELCGRHNHYQARNAVMLAGIGLGLWLVNDDEAACCDFHALNTFVDVDLPLDDDFPFTMSKLRHNQAWAKPLVVLWDDPNRRPYDIDDPNDPHNSSLSSLSS